MFYRTNHLIATLSALGIALLVFGLLSCSIPFTDAESQPGPLDAIPTSPEIQTVLNTASNDNTSVTILAVDSSWKASSNGSAPRHLETFSELLDEQDASNITTDDVAAALAAVYENGTIDDVLAGGEDALYAGIPSSVRHLSYELDGAFADAALIGTNNPCIVVMICEETDKAAAADKIASLMRAIFSSENEEAFEPISADPDLPVVSSHFTSTVKDGYTIPEASGTFISMEDVGYTVSMRWGYAGYDVVAGMYPATGVVRNTADGVDPQSVGRDYLDKAQRNWTERQKVMLYDPQTGKAVVCRATGWGPVSMAYAGSVSNAAMEALELEGEGTLKALWVPENTPVGAVSYETEGNADIQIEAAVRWACRLAEDDSVGYEQLPGRDTVAAYDGSAPLETDCSALVHWALVLGGGFHDLSCYYGGTAFCTYTETLPLTECGWVAYPYDPDRIQRGDVLLRDDSEGGSHHHTGFYLGDGLTVEALLDENGNISGGEAGDQSGGEVLIRANTYPWTEYLRYEGPGNWNPETGEMTAAKEHISHATAAEPPSREYTYQPVSTPGIEELFEGEREQQDIASSAAADAALNANNTETIGINTTQMEERTSSFIVGFYNDDSQNRSETLCAMADIDYIEQHPDCLLARDVFNGIYADHTHDVVVDVSNFTVDNASKENPIAICDVTVELTYPGGVWKRPVYSTFACQVFFDQDLRIRHIRPIMC